MTGEDLKSTEKRKLPAPLEVECLQCEKNFQVKFVVSKKGYSQKNNWNRWTEKGGKDLWMCDECLVKIYYDKLAFWEAVKDLKKRAIFKSYIHQGVFGNEKVEWKWKTSNGQLSSKMSKEVSCSKCKKTLVIVLNTMRKQWSQKNNLGYLSEKDEDEDKWLCNLCILKMYRNKPLYWKTVKNLKKRNIVKGYIHKGVYGKRKQQWE